MKKRPPQAPNGEQGEQSPRLRLNKRLKDILATGILPSLSPSALTVLLFAQAHADFTTCKVFLGARTVAGKAFKSRQNRTSARRGIAELRAIGILVPVKDHTHRQATVYRLTVPKDRAQGCAPTGHKAVPSQGTRLCPQRAQGCAPKHSSNVPSTLKERRGKRPRADAEGDAPEPKQAARLRALQIKPQRVAVAK
jgi:hypothetical protein